MKTTSQTYVLTLHSPSRSALRIWTGKNLHALRHCSKAQISHVLWEMQQHLDDLMDAAKPVSSGASYSLNRGR
jgi:hypothetical protein